MFYGRFTSVCEFVKIKFDLRKFEAGGYFGGGFKVRQNRKSRIFPAFSPASTFCALKGRLVLFDILFKRCYNLCVFDEILLSCKRGER